LIHDTSALLRKVGNVEDYVNPNLAFTRGETLIPSSLTPASAGEEIGEAVIAEGETNQVAEELTDFRVHVRRWLEGVMLPIDQLVLTLAQDIFTEAADLALAHKLALVLRKAADDHSEWRLPELTAELAVIARNERRFIGFSADDSGFDPDQHKGKVVVTTMHKAKGLEWDRVYLMSVNNYDFPSNQPNDRFISERWFLRNSLNLEAEALAQLSAAMSSSEYDWYDEGRATLASRVDYVKERLRLLFVGITRAKRELIVTWNTGRQGDATPALALAALMGWWEK
jgi:DNA helicase-2/ATP-dependent DNA helicase PcrA